MSTKIYTMTHKKFNPPSDDTYIPLHVGRACAADLGYMGDDTGDNISKLNCYYGELTGMYWMWKNLPQEGNVGVCHYRRFFLKDSTHIMSEPDFDRILSEYDIITSRAFYAEKNYREYYGDAHPVKDLETGRVMITSQNHGFAVDEDSLPPCLKPTHRSLFDGSLQGIERTDTPAFSFQGHPEASPGPHDVSPLFDHFVDLMKTYRGRA